MSEESYSVSVQLESKDPVAEVASQVGSALAHLDPADYSVKSISVYVLDAELVPTREDVLALEEEIIRLMAIGIGFEQGHTMASIRDQRVTPGPNTLRMAREKFEELRNAW